MQADQANQPLAARHEQTVFVNAERFTGTQGTVGPASPHWWLGMEEGGTDRNSIPRGIIGFVREK
jgi:hypothetical protein